MKWITTIVALACCACERHRSADVEGFSPNFEPMIQAYAEARKTMPEFVAALQNDRNPRFRYLAKVRVEADQHVEYVWLEPVQFSSGVVSGPVINDFVEISSVKKGDLRKDSVDNISDWAILDENDNILKGGFTLKVMEAETGKKP